MRYLTVIFSAIWMRRRGNIKHTFTRWPQTSITLHLFSLLPCCGLQIQINWILLDQEDIVTVTVSFSSLSCSAVLYFFTFHLLPDLHLLCFPSWLTSCVPTWVPSETLPLIAAVSFAFSTSHPVAFIHYHYTSSPPRSVDPHACSCLD